jgi:hypothetical protein
VGVELCTGTTHVHQLLDDLKRPLMPGSLQAVQQGLDARGASGEDSGGVILVNAVVAVGWIDRALDRGQTVPNPAHAPKVRSAHEKGLRLP